MKPMFKKLSDLLLTVAILLGLAGFQGPTVEAKVHHATQATQGVKIISVTSPAARNSYATLRAHVKPGATAYIDVEYKSGSSKAKGLGPKKANASGNVSWTWKVGGRTTIGSWPITVTSNGKSATTEIEVVH